MSLSSIRGLPFAQLRLGTWDLRPDTSVITLLTDFGRPDYFVGAMKGVILSINPHATIVDLTHDIPPQDIAAGAFTLLSCYKDFPAGAIHVAVVDPGVGSDRRALLIECGNQFFVGPDNGLFSWICEREADWTAIQLTNERFFRRPVSHTFHGRDVFAPVAAALSRGVTPSQFGAPFRDIVRLETLEPTVVSANALAGRIIHIDRFGNCVTSFTAEHLRSRPGSTAWRFMLDEREITSFHAFFADAAANEIFCTIGSAGFVEICARNASAAALLDVKRGQKLQLIATALTELSARQK